MNSGARSVSATDSPTGDELEVSLFGPGVGESVVVHLGAGEWLVVDSCVERSSTEPVALRYLKRLGVDPARAIKLVVVTHWHDDHMRGISQVFRVAQASRFACSAALQRREFYTLVASRERAMISSSGIDEFAEVLEILSARAPVGASTAGIGPQWATANQRLFQRAAEGESPRAEVFALSPSPASLTLGFAEIGAQQPPLGTQKRRLVALTPNRASVVLHIAVDDMCAVLGADLENSSDPTVGWQAIITSDARPQARSAVFKVAHHGSPNADHPDVWPGLLEDRSISIVTPYSRGVRPLPSASDLSRLKSRSQGVYCTAIAGGGGLPRRASAVEKTLREMAKSRKVIDGRMGHVRVRLKSGKSGEPRVDLFDGAFKA
jgi:hypothetical protein